MDGKDGKQRVLVKHLYQNDPEIGLNPKNSKFKQAVAITNEVIKNLDLFKEENEKKIQLGNLDELSKKELAEILKKPHHFCCLSMVQSEDSESTQARMINNTKAHVHSVETSSCLENKVPVSKIGDSHNSLMNVRLYQHGYSSHSAT